MAVLTNQGQLNLVYDQDGHPVLTILCAPRSALEKSRTETETHSARRRPWTCTRSGGRARPSTRRPRRRRRTGRGRRCCPAGGTEFSGKSRFPVETFRESRRGSCGEARGRPRRARWSGGGGRRRAAGTAAAAISETPPLLTYSSRCGLSVT